MPTVLITGFNGFVAVHTALEFLSEGWSVRGTVRSKDKGDKTVQLPVFEPYRGKVSFVVVEDLVEGDYTEALKGVDAIAHCASPWHLKGESWASYRDPAVKGTSNIIKQAAKVDSIKAVGVVSSFAAIFDCLKPFYELDDKTYTEADWLPYSEEDCEKMEDKGDGKAQTLWYCASKKFAEIAAVDSWKAAGQPFSLSTLCPPMIFGPAYHYGTAEGLAQADVSTSSLYAAMVAGKDKKVPPTGFTAWVDVRDVAKAFYVTITKHISGRYQLAGGLFDYDTVAAIAARVRPDLEQKGVIPQHEKENTPMSKGSYKLDASKAEKELGIKFYTLDETVKDTVDQFEKLGAVNQ